MEHVIYALKLAGIILCMTLIIPLMVAGGAGSWKAGWEAWKSYLKIMGGMVLIFGGFGMLMALADWINR